MSHAVTRELEDAIARYTGAPYCVAVSSCTAALELCLARLCLKGETVSIPARTYASVPQVIVKQGGRLYFDPKDWAGVYQLKPLPIFDCAKRFTKGMYVAGQFQCISFHVAKILGDTQGGAILTDHRQSAEWFRKARFDGRTEGVPLRDEKDLMIGFHCYLSPDVASRLLLKMQSASFNEVNEDQGPDLEREYCDLSTMECFRAHTD